jgi:hypothetical protein
LAADAPGSTADGTGAIMNAATCRIPHLPEMEYRARPWRYSDGPKPCWPNAKSSGWDGCWPEESDNWIVLERLSDGATLIDPFDRGIAATGTESWLVAIAWNAAVMYYERQFGRYCKDIPEMARRKAQAFLRSLR